VSLIEVDAESSAYADIRIQIANTSLCGAAVDGVLGCSTIFGDISFLDGWNWYSGADATAINANQYDFQTIATHEVGHAIGLEHSADSNSAMYGSLSSGIARRGFTAQDLELLTQDDGHDDENSLTAALRAAGPSTHTQNGGHNSTSALARMSPHSDSGHSPSVMPLDVRLFDRLAPLGRLDENDALQAHGFVQHLSRLGGYHIYGGGDDVLLGGDGDDMVLHGVGRDLMTSAIRVSDSALDRVGSDVLIGGFGADRTGGSAHNDSLLADELTGTHQSANVAIESNGQSFSFGVLRAIQDSDVASRGSYEEIIDEVISSEREVLTGASGADWFIN
jgi:Ca2+-binding RTX toxin-like protein